MDIGATNHISKTLPILNKTNMKHTFVELPNGEKTKIDSIGSVKMSNSITLTDVLYVPDFKFNLLSISQLTQSLGCNVTFYPDYCVVQDLTQRRRLVRAGRVMVYIISQQAKFLT